MLIGSWISPSPRMSYTSAKHPSPHVMLVFGPLNHISAQWDHKTLCSALENAINCKEVPGPSVSHNGFDPKYITIPLGTSHVNGIAFIIGHQSTPGAFKKRIDCLLPSTRKQPVDDFQRALEYQNLWVIGCKPIMALPWYGAIGSFTGFTGSLRRITGKCLVPCLQSWTSHSGI